MADIKHPLYPDVTVDSASGVPDAGGNNWTYTATKGGSSFTLPMMQFPPGDLSSEEGLDALAVVLQDVGSVDQPSDQGSLWEETISPAIQKAVPNLVGAPVEIANLLLRVGVDAPVNLAKWAAEGFEGNIPSDRYASSADPWLGSKQIVAGFEAVGDVARKGIESGVGSVTVPESVSVFDFDIPVPVLGGEKVGVATLLQPFAFDMTPDESTKAKKYISLITQITAGAPMEGAVIGKLAVQLAKSAENVTYQSVLNAISELQMTRPKTAAAYETIMGTAVGGSMVTSIEVLDAVYPDAPQWMKNTVMAGGGILLPIGGMTATRAAWDIGLKTPIVKWPLQMARGFTERLTPSGARKAAAHALQTPQSLGSDWRNRSEILDVTQQLRLALTEGREMDPFTRISYTTPQLARSEANVLEAKLAEALSSDRPPTTEQIAAQRHVIEKLRGWSNFQEGHLKTITEGKIGAQAYAKYSERMIERSNSIFDALDDLILKLDVGGIKHDGDPKKLSLQEDWNIGKGTGAYVYTDNILRAVQEGQSTNISPERLEAIQLAFDKVNSRVAKVRDELLADAQMRVEGWRERMPEKMSDEERANFDFAIRRELDTAYKEMDFYEDALWKSIDNFDAPKTESFITPDGQDLGPQLLIDGVPIGEHFAAKAAAIRGQAGEAQNQSKWLWMLAGRTALVEQAAKGAGPDATKVATQENRLAFLRREAEAQDAIVSREQAKLEDIEKANVKARLEELQKELYDVGAGHFPSFRGSRAELMADIKSEQSALAEGATLGPLWRERLPESARKAYDKQAGVLTRAMEKLRKQESALLEAQGKLDITMGAKVTSEGAEVNVADEILDTSALGVKTVDGVPVGRSGQEVHNIISHLKRELAHEVGQGATSNAKKIRAISDTISDLQRAIEDPENFTFNVLQRQAAVRATALKKHVFEKGSIGKLRGFTRTGEPRVPIERTIDTLVPGSKDRGKQDVALRELENALTPITTGDNTPVRMVVNDNGTTSPEFNPDFNLQKYAEAPPPPFERMLVGDGGRSYGFKVVEGTQNTPANIDIVRNTLWDRFSQFGSGTEFNSSAASKWINDNKAAIGWLAKATGKDTGFEDLANAERVARSIKNAKASNLDTIIEELHVAKAFDETFTEEGFRTLVENAAKQDSEIISAATLLDNPDPMTLGETFLKTYENPIGKPVETLNNTLKILEKGRLEDGSNPALEGFKQAVAEALIKRAVTGAGDGSPAAQEALRLSQSLRTDVRLWDPTKLMELSQSPQISRLLSGLYGEEAPVLFSKIAQGAQDQFAISKAAQRGVALQDKGSPELAGNIGRMLGGLTARAMDNIVSALVLTGVGRRQAIKMVEAIRGVAVEKLIVDMLMNPKLAAEAMAEFPLVSPTEGLSFPQRFKLWAHESFITKNGKRLRRMGRAPGILYEIGEPTKYEELEGPVLGPVTEAAPEAPPTRQMAARPMQPPSAASVLSQVSPVQPLPQQVAAASPDTMQRGQQVFGPMDPVFAKDGGIMSVNCKPRQMVG